jgi:hypothetical protein
LSRAFKAIDNLLLAFSGYSYQLPELRDCKRRSEATAVDIVASIKLGAVQVRLAWWAVVCATFWPVYNRRISQ